MDLRFYLEDVMLFPCHIKLKRGGGRLVPLCYEGLAVSFLQE